MKSMITLMAGMIISLGSISQTINLDTASIPAGLRKHASMVNRLKETHVVVHDVDNVTFEGHEVRTIMTPAAQQFLYFVQHTRKDVTLQDAEIKVYDATGKQIGRYRKKDMTTIATGEGLIEDGYATYYKVVAPSYPITMELNYSLKLKSTLTLPTYSINSPGEAIQLSRYILEVPKDLTIHYKNNRTNIKPEVVENEKSRTYRWEVRNEPAYTDEEGSSDDDYPRVYIAPSKFSLYGHEGDLSSWKSYGLWMLELYKDVDQLPEDRKAFYRNLVAGATDDREKVRRIYSYLQTNFRYVSIQLGIGGFKPFPASFTDSKKYGDCKGLSTFMKAALSAVGIKSYVAIINAEYNSSPIDPDFPADNRLNHVILCVPNKKDTIWLECTSNTADFAHLGPFTENRYAILLTEQGGVVVPTPKSNCRDNVLIGNTRVRLKEDGSGTCTSRLDGTGYFKEIFHDVMQSKEDDRKMFLVQGMGFHQPDQLEIKAYESGAVTDVSLNMGIEKIPAFVAGSKMFLTPRLYHLWGHKLPTMKERKTDYYFRMPYVNIDTTVFELPEGYVSETIPAPKELSCPYGHYSIKFVADESAHTLTTITELVLTQNRIPARDYEVVRKFFDDIGGSDAQRLVIRKQ